MGYQRVLPRDLFNEASLLKCYGALWIALEERYEAKARFSEDDVSSFDIVQRDDDGAIFVENLALQVGTAEYRLTRPMNSRQPWPLYAEEIGNPDCEPVAVFDDSGKLSADMQALLNK